jgi:hypothetical protein
MKLLPYLSSPSFLILLVLSRDIWQCYSHFIDVENADTDNDKQDDNYKHENIAFLQNNIFHMMDNDVEEISNRRRLDDDVKMNECLDATKFFSTRFTNGTNVYKTHFDCQCSGDITSSFFILSCSLEDYCFMADDDITEQCFNRDDSFAFLVNPATATIISTRYEKYCLEYTKNGPVTGPLCRQGSSSCFYLMKDTHGYTTKESIDICTDSTMCQLELPQLGYTKQEVDDLCPYTTLNGVQCSSTGITACGENDPDRIKFHTTMPDCSNVESCATSSCQTFDLVNSEPNRLYIKYPGCILDKPLPPSAPTSAGSSPYCYGGLKKSKYYLGIFISMMLLIC